MADPNPFYAAALGGLTRSAAARRAGVAHSTLQQVGRPGYTPGVALAVRLADAAGLTDAEFGRLLRASYPAPPTNP